MKVHGLIIGQLRPPISRYRRTVVVLGSGRVGLLVVKAAGVTDDGERAVDNGHLGSRRVQIGRA